MTDDVRGEIERLIAEAKEYMPEEGDCYRIFTALARIALDAVDTIAKADAKAREWIERAEYHARREGTEYERAEKAEAENARLRGALGTIETKLLYAKQFNGVTEKNVLESVTIAGAALRGEGGER